MTVRKLAIVGCGGMGREALWIANDHNRAGRAPQWDVAGFLTSDKSAHGSIVDGVPVLGPEAWLFDHPDVWAVIAIGNPRARQRVAVALQSQNVSFATLIHPSVPTTGSIEVGAGTIVSAGAVLTTDLRVGEHVIINVNAAVMHDTVLEDFATFAPGVSISGHCVIEMGADLGANSCVIPLKRVGRGAIIGAGAVVAEHIPPNVVAVGVPAKPARTLPEDEWL